MAQPDTVHHITIGHQQAEVFITTRGHVADLHVTRGIAGDVTTTEIDHLIAALQQAKSQIKAFQLARITAGRAALLHTA